MKRIEKKLRKRIERLIALQKRFDETQKTEKEVAAYFILANEKLPYKRIKRLWNIIDKNYRQKTKELLYLAVEQF